MINRYANWLHTRWPAGLVEKLPEADENGMTNLKGVFVVGDLTGIPLLKFSAHSGVRAIRRITGDPQFKKSAANELFDVAIIGAGVSGVAAAMEAKKAGLKFVVFEASEAFSTLVNFPKGKPIYTYPSEMTPDGDLQFRADIKEGLVAEMEEQRRRAGIEPVLTRIDKIERKANELLVYHAAGKGFSRAQRVIVAIGQSGNFRKLNVPGEMLDKVSNRLHDPKEFANKKVLVVGGGDSALETAIAIAKVGATVTLSYRKKEFSRPKSENMAAVKGSSIDLQFESTVKEIRANDVVLSTKTIPNDYVFTMIGREAPLDFFRRSAINIRGEWRAKTVASFALFFAFCTFLYLWKGGTPVNRWFTEKGWFPFNIPATSTLNITLRDPGFYYSLAYTLLVSIFGYRRIKQKKTPYVTRQTLTLIATQVLPLFLLPYFVFPYLGHFGAFDGGAGKWFADEFFPVANYGHGREYWRAFGFILAWPLFIWNVFSEKPMWGWLAISVIQTFVIIPLIVRRWGKGAYCGWICSCGALAETLGDAHRQKMPHGPFWNRLNMLGQVILAAAFVILGARVISWIWPETLKSFYYMQVDNYYHFVDIGLAGIIGVGLYFHFSGRVWCRFACPLAALMHIYARFSRFRIFAKKEKCISCNLCTTVCHQGIDVMNFANKGTPMEDPECVRCSACVQSCPTGVLTFGRFDDKGGIIYDSIAASPVQMRETASASR